MPLFFTVLAKKYNPYDIDNGMFAMNCAAPRSLPIVASKDSRRRLRNSHGKRQARFKGQVRQI